VGKDFLDREIKKLLGYEIKTLNVEEFKKRNLQEKNELIKNLIE
jgi:hypothetical protein